MTRAQRRAHRIAWAVLSIVLLGLVGWALTTRGAANARAAQVASGEESAR